MPTPHTIQIEQRHAELETIVAQQGAEIQRLRSQKALKERIDPIPERMADALRGELGQRFVEPYVLEYPDNTIVYGDVGGGTSHSKPDSLNNEAYAIEQALQYLYRQLKRP